jgi:RHS repeat-associated protein
MYDGNGNRVRKIKGSNTTYYYGDAYEKRNTVGIIHLFANHQRLASIRTDGKNQYYHGNHLGSASVITDQNGNLKQKIEYFPYGTYRYGTSPDQQMGTYDYDTTFPNANYTFTDQEDDDETGLYNYKARLYDPQIGRFISADSIVPRPGDLQSFNRYSYCSNNPLVYVDPSGHIDIGDTIGPDGAPDSYADWPTVDVGINTGVEVGVGDGKTSNNNSSAESDRSWLGQFLDFLSNFKNKDGDFESEKDTMLAQNKEFSGPPRSAWDKSVELAGRMYNWLDALAKAIGIIDTGKTAIDSAKENEARSQKWDGMMSHIKDNDLTREECERLGNMLNKQGKDVTGPPARVGEKGIGLAY